MDQQATARQRDHGPRKAAQGSARVKVRVERSDTHYAGIAANPGSVTMANIRFRARIIVTD